MKKTVIYPGTFDPLTLGHIDLIERATRLFDQIIVGIAASPKKKPIFTLEERVDMATRCLQAYPQVRVIGFETLLTAFAKQHQATLILRGLRGITDFDYEFQMAEINHRMSPTLENIFLMPGEQYRFISASLIREIAFLGGDVSAFVPALVAESLKNKLKQ